MSMLSDNLVKSTIQERRPAVRRVAKEQVRAGSWQAEPEKNFWQTLKDRARLVWSGPRPIEEVVYSEDNLYHAEKLGMTPQDLHRLIEKSRLYERIAHGHALVEVENMSRKSREGRS